MSAGCKNSFWVFYFLYSALSLSLSALCVLPERNHCQSCCWCSLRLSRGSRSDPSGFVPKWGVKHTHRKADVCEKGHLPPSLCTNTPEHQCLVRQRTNIPPSLNLHTLHRLRYHVFFFKDNQIKVDRICRPVFTWMDLWDGTMERNNNESSEFRVLRHWEMNATISKPKHKRRWCSVHGSSSSSEEVSAHRSNLIGCNESERRQNKGLASCHNSRGRVVLQFISHCFVLQKIFVWGRVCRANWCHTSTDSTSLLQ